MDFEDNRLLTALYGEHNQHLAEIESRLGVAIASRGNRVAIEGAPEACETARQVLHDLYHMLETGHPIDRGDVDGAIKMREAGPVLNPRGEAGNDRRPGAKAQIATRKRIIKARTPQQAEYIRLLEAADMVFSIGPAGTGKTYLAVAMAVSKLIAGEVDRIILSRPAVEAGESLGFLPGDMREKVDPYLRPIYDALYDMLAPEQVEKRFSTGQIEIAPLAFMRGRTLSHAFVILDEAQNTTPMQMKMFLTRFGEHCRMVIAGDPSQVDLGDGSRSGLAHALETLGHVDGIETLRFTAEDVVRHPLVGRIVRAYDETGGS